MSGSNNMEIEFRYLLRKAPDLGNAQPSNIIQGYLSRSFERTRRIRIETLPDGVIKAYETIKGPKVGAAGTEDEKEIDLDFARAQIADCEGEVIEKNRYKIPADDGLTWEIDEFKGKLSGLWIAEVEVPSEDIHPPLPNSLEGVDITTDRRFANARLIDVEPDELKAMIDSVFERTL
jgi:adenylate cyclase